MGLSVFSQVVAVCPSAFINFPCSSLLPKSGLYVNPSCAGWHLVLLMLPVGYWMWRMGTVIAVSNNNCDLCSRNLIFVFRKKWSNIDILTTKGRIHSCWFCTTYKLKRDMRLGPIKLQAREKKFCRASQRLEQVSAQDGRAICTMRSLGGCW